MARMVPAVAVVVVLVQAPWGRWWGKGGNSLVTPPRDCMDSFSLPCGAALMKRTVYPWVIAGALVVAVRTLPAQEIRPRLKFQAHPASAHTLGITPDDKLLITRGDNGVKAWDLST